jgi:hypothetical protein
MKRWLMDWRQKKTRKKGKGETRRRVKVRSVIVKGVRVGFRLRVRQDHQTHRGPNLN